MSSRPPWFPGQYGRQDDDGATFSGEPYADGSETEPYAAASLHADVSNPYGDVPVPARSTGTEEVSDWLTGADPGSGGAPPAATRPADLAGDGTPAGYDGFYEPGGRSPSSWQPRKRRRLFRSARRHGPRGGRRRKGPSLVEEAPKGGAAPGAVPEPEVVPGLLTHRAPPGGAAVTGAEERSSGDLRRRKVLVAGSVAGVVLVVAVVGAALDRDADPDPTTSPTPASPGPSFSPLPAPTPLPSPTAVVPPGGEVAVGVTVDNGPVRVEVLGMTTGLTELTGTTASATAAGEYVVVRMRVTATASTAWFVDTDQRLTDSDGTEHLPDAGAGMAVDGNALWFAELEEGESAQGVVVFDVPPGTVPATLTVHGSDAGAGAPVALPGG